MLIFLIGMLIIPIKLLHFIQVSLKISSLQKDLPWSLNVKWFPPPIHWILASYFTLFHSSYFLVPNILLYTYLFMMFCSIKMQVY